MTAFVLIVSFPLLLGLLFGTLYGVAHALGLGTAALDRAGTYLYPAFLAIPATVALITVWRQDLFAECGLRLPIVPGWPAAAALAVSLAAGVLVAVALFYHELFWSRRLLAAVRGKQRVQGVLEGKTQVFASQQRRLSVVQSLLPTAFVALVEEFLWRGYLISYLERVFAFSLSVVVLVSAVTFGFNHYYFGVRNVVFKAFSGAVWALLTLATGSLVAAVVSHFLFDFLAWRRIRR